MHRPPLAPLTSRERAVAEFFHRAKAADVCLVVAAALLGVVAYGLGRAYCLQPGDPVSGPDGSGYCAATVHGHDWIAYVGAAVILALAMRCILGGRRYARRVALGVVSVLAISATAWVFSLPTGVG
jgi:hypothetical protein